MFVYFLLLGFSGLLSCLRREPKKLSGGGYKTSEDGSSSDESDDTRSLREVEATLAAEEKNAKDKYYRIKRQRQAVLRALARKKRSRKDDDLSNYGMHYSLINTGTGAFNGSLLYVVRYHKISIN